MPLPKLVCRLALSVLVLLPAGLPENARAQAAKPRVVTVDRIVAVVNDEVITQQELRARVEFAFGNLDRGYVSYRYDG